MTTTTHPLSFNWKPTQTQLISKIKSHVQKFMSNYDGSHDYAHIQRVLGLAFTIATTSSEPYDLFIITLASLLHDIGDRKYVSPSEEPTTMVEKLLLSLGADEHLAKKIQVIVTAVSYSNEVKDLEHVKHLIIKYPELAVVQDADRLDALGAIGVGRIFTYGGAHDARAMVDSLAMVDLKLIKLEGMIKTETGRELARERTERLMVFQGWWREETDTGRVAVDAFEAIVGDVDVDDQ